MDMPVYMICVEYVDIRWNNLDLCFELSLYICLNINENGLAAHM